MWMKVLLIRAHPLQDSYNAALADAAQRGLERGGHQVTRIDLYADEFNPVMSAQERRAYHDAAVIPPDIARYVELLRSHDALLFSYPTWCFGMPAILKGWFDRVFRPGVSMHIDGAVVTPLLSHIRTVIGVATYGRPRHMAWWMGDPPRKIVTRYVKWFCAKGARTHYLAHYHMNASTDASRAAFLRRVEERLSCL
jgi:NAD(P)H dehydrogenase (quinone)